MSQVFCKKCETNSIRTFMIKCGDDHKLQNEFVSISLCDVCGAAPQREDRTDIYTIVMRIKNQILIEEVFADNIDSVFKAGLDCLTSASDAILEIVDSESSTPYRVGTSDSGGSDANV